MATHLDREVIPLKPTLVIRKTGTTDAVQGTDLDEFRQAVQAGIDRLRASGAEVADFITRGADPEAGAPAASCGGYK
jgi:hypothetical protein